MNNIAKYKHTLPLFSNCSNNLLFICNKLNSDELFPSLQIATNVSFATSEHLLLYLLLLLPGSALTGRICASVLIAEIKNRVQYTDMYGAVSPIVSTSSICAIRCREHECVLHI